MSYLRTFFPYILPKSIHTVENINKFRIRMTRENNKQNLTNMKIVSDFETNFGQ